MSLNNFGAFHLIKNFILHYLKAWLVLLLILNVILEKKLFLKKIYLLN